MGPGPGQRVALHSALVGRGTISPSLRMWGWAQRPPLRWPVGARAPCVSPSPRSQPHHQGRSSRSMSSSVSWAIPGVCQCFTDLEARRAGAAFRWHLSNAKAVPAATGARDGRRAAVHRREHLGGTGLGGRHVGRSGVWRDPQIPGGIGGHTPVRGGRQGARCLEETQSFPSGCPLGFVQAGSVG